ncbi:Heptaprenyl diphosphate synthase component 1 [Planococcus massiliensis]|uniref:Heptaprenyl diphosphate synthase component 1 n=1 Tax=Planococcus massiliensis TaxID=1499687 RepID=A0A098ELB1_9BACL|nr:MULTISPECIES: heptaprenyl diphosphate synthase component 1 [Planococcus]MCJ1907362.1 heptaprenyl diphosphate synthase component 1 [Planococcus ruber]CEG22597.1 Heptaprenyl diphosphate synthase component 1 [Planococcus massiliensis]
MNEQQIHSKITSLEIEVLKAVKQRTLEKHTEGPSVERERLFFLLLPFLDGKQWSADIEQTAKTVSIVYAALHAHDQVKEDILASKKQQLTVLAGDFYSGIYYQMLSNMENLTMIKHLASAIISVSERKASFYDQVERPIQLVDELIQKNEIELIEAFYNFYGYHEYTKLAKAMLSYVRYENELKCLKEGGQSRILQLLNKSLRYPADPEAWLLKKLDVLHDQVLELIRDAKFDYELKNFMLHKITPHQHRAEQLTREG